MENTTAIVVTAESSILETVKLDIGYPKEVVAFDVSITKGINKAMFKMMQLGLGPPDGFVVTGYDQTWGEFETVKNYQAMFDYTSAVAKLLFDPPQNSFLVTSLKEEIKELEWRLNTEYEVRKPQIIPNTAIGG